VILKHITTCLFFGILLNAHAQLGRLDLKLIKTAIIKNELGTLHPAAAGNYISISVDDPSHRIFVCGVGKSFQEVWINEFRDNLKFVNSYSINLSGNDGIRLIGITSKLESFEVRGNSAILSFSNGIVVIIDKFKTSNPDIKVIRGFYRKYGINILKIYDGREKGLLVLGSKSDSICSSNDILSFGLYRFYSDSVEHLFSLSNYNIDKFILGSNFSNYFSFNYQTQELVYVDCFGDIISVYDVRSKNLRQLKFKGSLIDSNYSEYREIKSKLVGLAGDSVPNYVGQLFGIIDKLEMNYSVFSPMPDRYVLIKKNPGNIINHCSMTRIKNRPKRLRQSSKYFKNNVDLDDSSLISRTNYPVEILNFPHVYYKNKLLVLGYESIDLFTPGIKYSAYSLKRMNSFKKDIQNDRLYVVVKMFK